jgi:hypothetical protein
LHSTFCWMNSTETRWGWTGSPIYGWIARNELFDRDLSFETLKVSRSQLTHDCCSIVTVFWNNCIV